MNLLFHSTETFEQDLQQFDIPTKERIEHCVNQVARAFVEDKQTFARRARKPYSVRLSNGFDSSLYSVVVEPKETKMLLDHQQATEEFGASIFWIRPSLLFLEPLEEFIAGWQTKRDRTRRGIVEIRE